MSALNFRAAKTNKQTNRKARQKIFRHVRYKLSRFFWRENFRLCFLNVYLVNMGNNVFAHIAAFSVSGIIEQQIDRRAIVHIATRRKFVTVQPELSHREHVRFERLTNQLATNAKSCKICARRNVAD